VTIVLRDPAGEDASFAINAALQQAAVLGGSEVVLSAGRYLVPATSSIRWPANANGVSLIGEGPLASVIQAKGGRYSDLLDLTTGNLAHVRIAGVGISALGVIGSGAMIHAANCYDLLIDRVRLDGPFNDGIVIDGGQNQYLTTITCVTMPGDPRSYRCLVIGESGYPQDTYINLCKFAATQYGIWVQNAGGVYPSSTETLGHVQHGFITYPGGGQNVDWVQATQLLADSCGGTGIYLGSGGGAVRGVSLSNSWSSSNTNGVEIAPECDDVCFDATTRFLANRNRSVIDYGGTNVRISAWMDRP
jgi:hypothetical protein